jgi:hypothetical protein
LLVDSTTAKEAITMTGVVVTIVGTGVRATITSATVASSTVARVTMVRIVVVKAIMASSTVARIVVVKAIMARVTMETTVSIVVVVKKSKLPFFMSHKGASVLNACPFVLCPPMIHEHLSPTLFGRASYVERVGTTFMTPLKNFVQTSEAQPGARNYKWLPYDGTYLCSQYLF